MTDIKALREAAEKWKAATKIWSLDPATDAIATMKIGENMLFAGIDYIATLQNYAAAQGARITALEEALKPFAEVSAYFDSETEGFDGSEDINLRFGELGFTSVKLDAFRRASTLLKES